jgi:tetratricopeptide (TPR) repeat protein
MLGEPGQQSGVLERLLKETEGNAFFLVEVVRALAEEAGRLSRIGQKALPDKVFAGGVQTIIRRRLQRAPDWARPLLRPAAVAGRELDLALLQHIAANQPDYFPQNMALDNWLNGCTEAAVLDVQEGHWRFAHDKLRQALLDDLPEEERPGLHRLVAQTIEIIHANSLDDYAYILFEHWQSAGSQEKESYYAWLAGKQVHTAGQFQEAERLLRYGLGLTSEHEQQHRANLLLALGNALERQGQYELSRQSLEEALPLATPESVEHIEILNRLSLIYLRQDQYQQAQEYGQAALKLAHEQKDRLKIGATLSNLGDISWAIGDYDQAESYMQEALSIGREIENLWLMSICLNGLGLVAWVREDSDQARRHFEHSKTLEEQAGNRWGVSISLLNLGELAYLAGDYESANTYLNESLTIQVEAGNRPVMAEIFSNLGIMAAVQGDNETARRHLLEALDHAYETNTTSGVLKSLVALAGVRAAEGDRNGAAEWLGLAFNHPACNSNVQFAAKATVELLKEKLSPDLYEAALARGQTLDLDTVVEEIRGMKTAV